MDIEHTGVHGGRRERRSDRPFERSETCPHPRWSASAINKPEIGTSGKHRIVVRNGWCTETYGRMIVQLSWGWRPTPSLV